MINAHWSFPDFTYDFMYGKLGIGRYRAGTIINDRNQSESFIYAGPVLSRDSLIFKDYMISSVTLKQS